MSIKQRFEQEPIYLMDGSAFVYRGFYANQSMQRSDGFPTSALFIVARILMRILREEQPKHFAFVLDGHGPNFRHELFPLYKAQRSATPEDLIKQIDPIHRLIKALGLHLEVSDSCEADDCLASLAKRYREERPVILVATDKDLKQCLHDNVMMWDPASRDEKIVTLKSFEEETGLRPTQWPDVQAIIGDSSDNIPGVRGVGPKTAEKLFHEYASLEAIRDGFASMKPALQKKFDGQLEAMFLYRQLTTLDTSRCASLTLDAMRVRPVNRQEAATLLREFELSSLERELATLIRDGRVAVEHDASETVDSGKSGSMRQLSLLDTPKAEPRQRLRDASDPFFDALEGNPVAVLGGHGELAIAVGDKEIVYTGLTPKLVDRLLKAKFVIAPDVKALLHTHADWGRIPPEKWFDLGLASYLLEPEDRDYGWPKLSARWGTALGLSAANPGLLALTMTDQLLKRLSGAHLVELMKTLELPLIPVLADMESAGVKLDAEALAGFLEEVQKDLDRITEDVYREAQGPFNIRSAQQLGDVLFNRLKLPVSGKTRGGQASTSQDVLEKLSGHHPVVDALLNSASWKSCARPTGTAAPRRRRRTHPDHVQPACQCNGPPFVQQPEFHPGARSLDAGCACFTAPEELISADYSQIELRVLAHLSRDETLLAAFREGADIHARTASLLFDAPPSEITPDQRRNAKTINFGLIYGMGPQKLAQELKIPLSEAKAFMARYFERLQGLKHFYENVEEMAREQGYVTTLAGRRRPLPDIQAESQQARSLARRQAINTLIQGSAADIIKLAMLAVHGDETLRTLDAKLLLQVHDELLLEVPEAAAQEAGERVAALMANVRPGGIVLDVPLKADWGAAENWGDAH
ncbi:MAG: DNA polymerase [Bilophila wadsworthia]